MMKRSHDSSPPDEEDGDDDNGAPTTTTTSAPPRGTEGLGDDEKVRRKEPGGEGGVEDFDKKEKASSSAGAAKSIEGEEPTLRGADIDGGREAGRPKPTSLEELPALEANKDVEKGSRITAAGTPQEDLSSLDAERIKSSPIKTAPATAYPMQLLRRQLRMEENEVGQLSGVGLTAAASAEGGPPPPVPPVSAQRSLEELSRTAAKVRSSGLSAEEVQREMGIIYSRRKRVRQKMRQESLEEKKQGLVQENVALKRENAFLENALRKAFSDVAAFEKRFASAHHHHYHAAMGPRIGPPGPGVPGGPPTNPQPPHHHAGGAGGTMGYLPPHPMYYGGGSPMGYYGPPPPYSPNSMYPPPHPPPMHWMQHPPPPHGGPPHPPPYSMSGMNMMTPYGPRPPGSAAAATVRSPARRGPSPGGPPPPPPPTTEDAVPRSVVTSTSPKRLQGWDPDRLRQIFASGGPAAPTSGGSSKTDDDQQQLVATVPTKVLRGLLRDWKASAPVAAQNLEAYLGNQRGSSSLSVRRQQLPPKKQQLQPIEAKQQDLNQ